MKAPVYSLFVAAAASLFTVSCSQEDGGGFDARFDTSAPAPGTTSGSYSRILTVNNHLYAVDQTSVLTYDITNRDNPVEVGRTEVGLAIETIYHHDGNLFIGSREAMYTFSISANGLPVRRGTFDYSRVTGMVEPCDPVVANRSTAYATLYTEDNNGACGTRQNVQLLVAMDISNLDRPSLINTYPVQTPRGLSLDGNLLFVCNDRNGLSVFDVTNPAQARLISRIQDISAWDAIASDGLLIVVGTTQLIQYDYRDPSRLVELSRLPYPRT